MVVINQPKLYLQERTKYTQALYKMKIKKTRTPEEIEEDWKKPENQKKLKKLIAEFGEYKKIVDSVSGVTYKVPTKDIITKGLKQQGLDKYPIWEDD